VRTLPSCEREKTHTSPASAVVAALAQLGAEGLQDLRIELANLHRAEHRPDVLADLSLVPMPGARLDVDHIEPAIDQLVHGLPSCAGCVLVNLVEQPRPDLLGFGRSTRTCTDRHAQVHPAAGWRVDPGVHGDPQCSGREALDPAAPSLPTFAIGRRHSASARTRGTTPGFSNGDG
jgi:hypothetical protein